MSKGRVFLFHWNKEGAEEYAKLIRGWGWDVDFEYEDGTRGGSSVKLNPPNAVIFYLMRLPSHSRATAEYLGEAKSTRSIPLIFVGGEGEVLEKMKKKFLSAKFTSAAQLESTLANCAND